MTDIEGNYDYWRRYIEFSKVICGTPGDIDFCDDRGQLVFGGDICDRGAGLCLYLQLLSLTLIYYNIFNLVTIVFFSCIYYR